VQKKGGIFNLEKLDWINREWLLRQSKNIKMERLIEETSKTKFKNHEKLKNSIFLEKFLKIILDRIHRWGEVSEIIETGEWDYFFETPTLNKERLPWKTQDLASAKKSLNSILTIFESNSDLEIIKKEILSLAEREGKGETLWPLRYTLSGQEKSPDPFTLTDILHSTESIKRIKNALEII
jgi:glutamyl/glutaminyl-tRNA synthetase